MVESCNVTRELRKEENEKGKEENWSKEENEKGKEELDRGGVVGWTLNRKRGRRGREGKGKGRKDMKIEGESTGRNDKLWFQK